MKPPGDLTVSASGEREIVMMRSFDAPRAAVFAAYTKPEQLWRWLGAFGGWSLVQCDIDLRVGGRYRYVWRGSDGGERGVQGVYREIVPGERIVCTETFDDPWYEGEGVATSGFAELSGRTTLTVTVHCASQWARDSVFTSNLRHGVAASYDALAALLISSEIR